MIFILYTQHRDVKYLWYRHGFFISMLNVSALGRYLGINDSLMRQYHNGSVQISDRQLEKIEAGIRRLGSELAALRLF